MTNSTNSKKQSLFQKGDCILLILLFCLSGILFLFILRPQHTGSTVTVTVDGTVYGSWSLSDDQEIEITSDYGTNRLRINNGTAAVIHADCPDLICVNHIPVSYAGERIVCLPNRMIVSISTPHAAQTDALSQ